MRTKHIRWSAQTRRLTASSLCIGRQAQSQADPVPSPKLPYQPANSGWDDEPTPHVAASPGRGRGRGRGSTSRGRAGPQGQPPAAAGEWRTEPSASQPGQDGWGDPVAVDTQGELLGLVCRKACTVDKYHVRYRPCSYWALSLFKASLV